MYGRFYQLTKHAMYREESSMEKWIYHLLLYTPSIQRTCRGLDVANQLRGSFSCQNRSHKWWHRLFFFLLGTTVVNAYIQYMESSAWLARKPMTHLKFTLPMALTLVDSKNPSSKQGTFRDRTPRAVHSLEPIVFRQLCVTCKLSAQGWHVSNAGMCLYAWVFVLEKTHERHLHT